MEDIDYLWIFQESHYELKQKLEYMQYELETTKKEANEEKMKNNEQINKLLQLLQTTLKERDDAKSQLQQTLSKLPPFSPNTLLTYPNYPTKLNSDSNNATNPHYPVVDSPQPAFPDTPFDRGNLAIHNLVKGRPLPPKGNLMEAVKKAGPLLETLLLVGSLPRWRNPPSLLTHPIPLVNIGGKRGSVYGSNFGGSVLSNGYFGSSSMLDFESGSSSKTKVNGRYKKCEK